MTLNSTSKLSIAELTLYLIMSPLAAYLAFRHGKHGLLGYFYLNTFCLVRFTASIVTLLPSSQNPTHPSIASAILSSIGLSPMMLALAGFLHETHVRHLHITLSRSQVKKITPWLWLAQLQIHAISIIGMVLVIIGTIKLVSTSPALNATDVKKDDNLRSAGALMMIVLWAGLAQYALYLRHTTRRASANFNGSNVVARLAHWTAVAAPFVGLRSFYSVLYTFDHTAAWLNPTQGALWVKVVFIMLAPLGAVVALCVGGWVSRDMEYKAVAGGERGRDGADGHLYVELGKGGE